MRILIVTDTIHAGGAETFVLRLARKLNQIGATADILCLNPDIEDPELIANFPELTIHRVAPPMLRWVKRADRLLKILGIDYSIQYSRTRKGIEKRGLLNYDVFHTHLMPPDLSFSILKQKYPHLRIVTTLHGDYIEYDDLWEAKESKKILNWPRKLELIKQSIDKWVYISKNQKAQFEGGYGVQSSEMEKIYNGYEPPVALAKADISATSEGLVFIKVARMLRDKGWEYLISAFKQIKGPHKLILVGKGEVFEEMKALAADDNRISFTGLHPNPPELVQNADVFVFASVIHGESLPTVVVEALYCGKPVISTNVGELEEMINVPETGEKAGYLLQIQDKSKLVDELVVAMNRYINDKELLNYHATLAPKAFMKFDMEVCSRRYLNVYKEVSDYNK